jgi:hypothetical protein
MKFDNADEVVNAEAAGRMLTNTSRLLRAIAQKDGGRWESVLMGCELRDDGVSFRIGIVRMKSKPEGGAK